ncbi:MAG: O-antigen ligase family protein [Terriglobia bacterium]
MLRDRTITGIPAPVLLALMVVLGAVSSLLVGRLGILAPIVVLLPIVSALIAPRLLHQALGRLKVLRKQFTWWHALWFLVIASGFQFRLRGDFAIHHEAVDAWALYRIGLMAITAAVLAIRLALKRGSRVRRGRLGPITALAIYTAVCAASTLWSVFPAWSLYKSVEYGVDVALLAATVATFASAADFKKVFDWNWTLDGILLGTVLLGALLWPSEALTPSKGLISVQLNGVMPQMAANGVGQLSAILSVIAISRLLRRPSTGGGRAFYGVLLTVGLATMIIAQTRSAILGFACGLVLLLYFSKRMGTIALVIAAATLLYSATGARVTAEKYMRRGESPQLLSSLSGRTQWWAAGWQEFVKSPWRGMGAYTARFTVLQELGQGDTSTIHNTYLEALLDVGGIGLIPLLVMILWVWKILIRELRDPLSSPARRQLALEAVAVLGILTCRSFFTVNFIWHPELDSLAILGYAALLRRRRSTAPSRYRPEADREGVLIASMLPTAPRI